MAVQYADRMSDSDALLWNNERDPMLRSTILSGMILDGPPDEARLRGAVDRALTRIPRLCQKVVLDPLGAAPPRWEVDPHFDIDYHMRRVSVPGDGTQRDLLDFAAPVAMQAFDKDRALWEFYRVDGLADGRVAVLMKIHHSLSDGVGLVRMTSSLVERSREPDPKRKRRYSLLEEPPEGRLGPFDQALEALRHRAGMNADLGGRVAGSLGRSALRFLRDPVGQVRSAGELAGSIGRSLRPVSEPMSPLMRRRSLGVYFDVIELPLDELKRPARAVGGTLNDAFVGAVMGGLRLYHEHHGAPTRELRMTMPINLREGESGKQAGNQFAPARFAVPIGIADPLARMRHIRDSVKQQRSEPALPLIDGIAGVLARLPQGLSVNLFGSMLKAIDFVTSNVPGPPFPVYSAGAKVERMFGFGPLSGAAANITLFSYDGAVNVAINTDPAAVPDGPFFTECMGKGLDEVLSVA